MLSFQKCKILVFPLEEIIRYVHVNKTFLVTGSLHSWAKDEDFILHS